MKNTLTVLLISAFAWSQLFVSCSGDKNYDIEYANFNVDVPDSIVQGFSYLISNSLVAQDLKNISLEAIEKGFKAAYAEGEIDQAAIREINQSIGLYLQSRPKEDMSPIPDSICEKFGRSYASTLISQYWNEPDFSVIAKVVTDNMDKPIDSVRSDKAYAMFRTFANDVVVANIKTENKEFLEWNKAQDGVITEESGLQHFILKNASGDQPQSPTDSVEVHYEGRLVNGDIFDSSYERDETLVIGLNQVIKGWTEGMQKMTVGSKWRFVIPFDLAYGPNGRPGIPPFSTLIFDVELLKVFPTTAAPTPPMPTTPMPTPTPPAEEGEGSDN